jgi:hypothetical protein
MLEEDPKVPVTVVLRICAEAATRGHHHPEALTCPVTEFWRRIGPSETTSSPSR